MTTPVSYRIEHKDSGLGPFRHAAEGCWDRTTALDVGEGTMCNLTGVNVVHHLVVTGDARFAYANLASLIRIVRDARVLEDLGFFVYEYCAPYAFHCKFDDQVVFSKRKVVARTQLSWDTLQLET